MADNKYHVEEWNPRTLTVAQNIINEIHEVDKNLIVFFMGAAALGLPGRNDIDLDVLSPTEKIANLTRRLTQTMGSPKETTKSKVVWALDREGFKVDLVLSDPKVTDIRAQKENFQILRAKSELLEEYRQLKIDYDGKTKRSYENAKAKFFERVAETKKVVETEDEA